jgi:hypothetical protein
LEIIVKKRNTTGCLTITGQEFFPETEKIKQLESQLADKDKLIEKLTQNVNVTTEKYKANLEQLENQLKCESDKVKAESEKLRKLKAAHTKEIEEVKKATKKSNNKDDAHLLATIRGLQSELLNKEKLMAKINKELDDVKKTNRTLQKEREKILSSKSEYSTHNNMIFIYLFILNNILQYLQRSSPKLIIKLLLYYVVHHNFSLSVLFFSNLILVSSSVESD